MPDHPPHLAAGHADRPQHPPLPPAGNLRLFVEWPIVGIELTAVELPCAPLLAAAARSEMLWADQR